MISRNHECALGEKDGLKYSGPACAFSAPPRLRGESYSSIIRRFLGTIVAVIREIFDEAAYERFLARTHSTRSVESYRDFLGDRESGAAPRPRCC
jgi:hypothetical protein